MVMVKDRFEKLTKNTNQFEPWNDNTAREPINLIHEFETDDIRYLKQKKR